MAISTQDCLNEDVQQVLERVRSVYSNASGASLSRLSDKNVIQTRLQTLFGMKFGNQTLSVIYEVLMTQALIAEKLGPGGFDLCIKLLLEKSNISKLRDALILLESEGSRSPSNFHMQNVINKITDHRISEILFNAIKLSGFGGKIVIEKSQTDLTSVELIRGYSFGLRPAFPITTKLSDPYIACIDGYVETVSEIHQLLESTTESTSSILLLVRGLSNDVLNTLRVNYDRGTLRVIPVIVPFDFNGINTLVDIATVVGDDVISSTKGQLISSLRLSDLKMIKSSTIYSDKIVLINSNTRHRVALHVENLKKKRADAPDESISRLFDMRIKSLSPNQVVIRLPDDEKFVTTSQTIDYTLRTLKSLIEHGVDKDGNLLATKAAGISAAIRTIATLDKLGAVITS